MQRARPDRDDPHRGSDARAGARFTVVIVTHNMHQAARVSDYTAFMLAEDARRRPADRVRRHRHDVHRSDRPAHRSVRDGQVRVGEAQCRNDVNACARHRGSATAGRAATRARLTRTARSAPTCGFAPSTSSVRYGGRLAIEDVTLDIHDRAVTAIIGPSGCGKSTLLRVFNRMNDLIANARSTGRRRDGRRRPPRAQRRYRAPAPSRRHGLPEAEPVPDEHLRERRLRPAPARHEARAAARRDRRVDAAPGRALG